MGARLWIRVCVCWRVRVGPCEGGRVFARVGACLGGCLYVCVCVGVCVYVYMCVCGRV